MASCQRKPLFAIVHVRRISRLPRKRPGPICGGFGAIYLRSEIPYSWSFGRTEWSELAGDFDSGYELEVFNALGATYAVVTARESQIEPLRKDELLRVRPQKLVAA